ncbi:MAG: hypothetical protein F9B45_18600 [Phycisphaera sp. RhM]|nr:hypothetical protein [Phycisphaera sp. RhM]
MELRGFVYTASTILFSLICVDGAVAGEALQQTDGPATVASSWQVANLAKAAGMEHKQIRSIAFEKDGSIWVGATDGLHRYDGYSFQRFDTRNGLDSNFIEAVLVDDTDQVFVATDRGVFQFDPRSNRFDAWEKANRPSIGSNEPGSALWIPGNRLRLYDDFDSIVNRSGFPREVRITGYFKDSDRREFVLTGSGLYQFEHDKWIRPLEVTSLDGINVVFRSAAETADGELLFTTDDAVFIRSDGEWSRMDVDRGYQLISASNAAVFAIAPLRHRADLHFAFFRWKDGDFEQASESFRLLKNWSYSHGMSPDGSVWMASYNRLIRWVRHNSQWQQFDAGLRPQFEDQRGRIWFSGQATAAVLDGDQWFQLDTVSWPLEAHDGSVWFHSPDQHPDGLTVVTGRKVNRIPVQETGLDSSSVIAVDGTGHIWVSGTMADGAPAVAVRDGEQWRTFQFESAATDVERAIAGAAGHGVWMLVTDESMATPRIVGVIDHDVVDTPPLPFLPRLSFRSRSIQMRCDAADRLWLKWHRTVLRFDGQPVRTWSDVTDQTGKSIQGWSCQGDRTWLASGGEAGDPTGLVCFDQGQWQLYETSQPTWADRWDLNRAVIGADSEVLVLGDQSVQQISLPFEDTVFGGLVDRRGRIWASTRESLLCYTPDRIAPRSIVVNAMSRAEEGETLQFELAARIRFQPNTREQIRFQRKIDGQSWSAPQPFVHLGHISDLSPGHHSIAFRAVDESGDIEPQPIDLSVVVIRPLWKRPWFVVSTLFVFGVAVVQTVRVVRRDRKLKHAKRIMKEQEILSRVNAQLEALVRDRTSELTESNNELREFAHSVSHDLRGPLQAMSGFAMALSVGYGHKLDAQAAEYLQLINDSAVNMGKLINDLLEYSSLRRSELKKTRVSLQHAVDDALRQIQDRVKDSDAEIHIRRPLADILGHHATIVQVISNLVGNAIKYVGVGARPQISIRTELQSDDIVRVIVKDKGIGIEPEDHQRIFSVFERVQGSESYPGTGIGLAIVSRGIGRLGGRCGVDSKPNQGSSFWFELPHGDSQDAEALPEARQQATAPKT